MDQESIIAMIRDLTSRLSIDIKKLGERAERAVIAEADVAGASPSMQIGNEMHRTIAQRLIAERRARRNFLPPQVFDEPAWDMLLALFIANEDGQILNIRALVASSHAPVTTSHRWIDHLHKLKLTDRFSDPEDRRRVKVVLTDAGLAAIKRYLDAIAGF